ncbi:PH domain-containing protein [Sphingomonas phyllosphaerae]|uniref:PH domain-containing protein n=1 Tax=Sphingomonas phyllosphaerae TaxID=257003 RepID=UPI0003B714B9|nr:PH domain-containing protein [Sphingomonas phyllosphaerae]
MGLFASHEVEPAEIRERFGHALIDGEEVLAAFRSLRDTAFLTNYRFVLVDVQGLTGSKVSFESVPYRSITRFAVESAGTFDVDSELRIWVSSALGPLTLKVSRNADPAAIHRLLAGLVLGQR